MLIIEACDTCGDMTQRESSPLDAEMRNDPELVCLCEGCRRVGAFSDMVRERMAFFRAVLGAKRADEFLNRPNNTSTADT
jgi:hypothetical protein